MRLRPLLETIRETIDNHKKNSPLAHPNPVLLAASKGQPATIIEEAIACGVTVFGENRVQEAQAKWPELKKRHPNITLHLIGPLQTNKVTDALALFDVIQTLDRPKLAEVASGELRVAKEQYSSARHSPLATRHFYLQINTGCEPQKAGILPGEADDFIRYCIEDLKLPVVGLMCVPPADQPPAPHFALLREIALRHGLKELSMGMSGDYETAIRMGSSCVRIGTALFGKRQ